MMPSKVASANFMSVRLAPSTTTASGIPRPSLGLAALGSPRAAIGRIGAGRGSTERGLGHHPIHALPFPGNAFQFVIFLESRLPDALKHALLFPQPKAIIPSSKLPVPVAAHSIGYPCATHTGWPPTSADPLGRAVLLIG